MDSKQDQEKSKDSFGLLVEDEDFQEFSAENWTGKDEEDNDVNFWKESLEYDSVGDGLNIQFKTYYKIQSQRSKSY